MPERKGIDLFLFKTFYLVNLGNVHENRNFSRRLLVGMSSDFYNSSEILHNELDVVSCV